MKTQEQRRLLMATHAIMETERMSLRPITLADAEDMYDYASNEETCRYVFPLHTSPENTKEIIAMYFLSAPLGKYALELKENGKMIGTIDIRVDNDNHSGELGYTLHPDYWGQGLMPEATRKLIWFAFEKLSLARVFAWHDKRNGKSGQVMKKCGMSCEGEIINHRYFKGEFVTDVLYGISDKEYREQKEKE